MNSLTSELVRNLYAFMAQRFGAQVVAKGGSVEMKAVSLLLDRMGIADQDDFMQRFATTIGHRIYVPFEPGSPTGPWSLLAQATTCVHECHHVWQYDQLGPAMFAYQYVIVPARRTLLEVQAYRTNMEVEYRLTGKMHDPIALANLLRSYAVSESDVMVAERMLKASVPTIRAGGITSRASQAALAWLKERGVPS